MEHTEKLLTAACTLLLIVSLFLNSLTISVTATLLPVFERIYAVDNPTIPPPTITTSTEIFLSNFSNLWFYNICKP